MRDHQAFDIIGDIHGCADQLERLLVKLGCVTVDGVYRHPDHPIIFLGDFIDRGPEQVLTLDIVRPMIDSGSALSVMGNHEFNAICYATEHGGAPIRPHSPKNTKQHQAFLDGYPLGSAEHRDAVAWFRTLPLFLDLGPISIVHACWCPESFDALQGLVDDDGRITDDLLASYAEKGSETYNHVERVLKGPEWPLPEGLSFHDKDGYERHEARFRWWSNEDALTMDRIELGGAELSEAEIDLLNAHKVDMGITVPEKPVFVGHYWLRGEPNPLSSRVACVDYSVAKGGPLAAYRWRGEAEIGPDGFVWVD